MSPIFMCLSVPRASVVVNEWQPHDSRLHGRAWRRNSCHGEQTNLRCQTRLDRHGVMIARHPAQPGTASQATRAPGSV